MLSDFFRINLPYGIAENENGEWMAFNREYLPLGHNNENIKGVPGKSYLDMPIYTKYKKVPEKLLMDLADEEHFLQKNESGKITGVFLYNDGTNPVNNKSEELWARYFDKVKKLSQLKI